MYHKSLQGGALPVTCLLVYNPHEYYIDITPFTNPNAIVLINQLNAFTNWGTTLVWFHLAPSSTGTHPRFHRLLRRQRHHRPGRLRLRLRWWPWRCSSCEGKDIPKERREQQGQKHRKTSFMKHRISSWCSYVLKKHNNM